MSRPFSQSTAMAPSTGAHVAALLRQAVLYHLDNFSDENALFFAERLVAQDPKSPESTFLLALCHFRLGDYLQAYEASKEDKSTGLRTCHLGRVHVFAQSCLALERYRDGAVALEKSRPHWSQKSHIGKHTATSRSLVPDASTLSCLLGKLYRRSDERRRAASCFEEALKLNPFMWDAFTSLCDLGAPIRVPNIFRVSEGVVRSLEQDGGSNEHKDGPIAFPLEPISRKGPMRPAHNESNDPFEQSRPAAFQDRQAFGNLMPVDMGEDDFYSKIAAARSRMAASAGASPVPEGTETPSGPSLTTDVNAGRGGLHPEPPQAPARRTRATQAVDSGILDAPPRLGYRTISKRREKGLDANAELQAAAEQPNTLLRSSATSISGIERKRTISGHPVQPRQNQPEEPGAPQRRSARLNMFKPSTTKSNNGAATIGAAATREVKRARPPVSRMIRPGSSGSSVGRVVSGNRKPLEENSMDVDHVETSSKPREALHQPPPPPKTVEPPDTVKVEESLKLLLDLLRRLAIGYQALSQFQCNEAIQNFAQVPRAHADTPWVLAQTGRALFEQAKYAEAEGPFRRLRALAPYRLEDLEIYSTVLWHLKKESELSYLAHDLIGFAWHSPQTWCVAGNAWSLASDREQALKCFKRATQLNRDFAYAHTLQGHEHVSNEEYDKAIAAYREALRADRRHYNAYYGIGKVHEKLGSYDKAYVYFHAASVIHPTNAVLICCIGTALVKQKQISQALQYYNRAIELAPQAAQTRFFKARALLAVGHFDEAQKELMILKDLAPDVAMVHFLLGRLYKNLNDKSTAVHHFTIALSLDPKASQLIKKAIESLEDEGGYDDSMVP